MNVSQHGIDLIKRHEGFSSRPYDDAAGYPTIGYGHRIRPEEFFDILTPEQAERLLLKDVQHAETAVRRLVTVELQQCQFDALVSFVYNVGEKAFEKSTLLRKLNNHELHAAAQEFKRWVYAGGRRLTGLETRRKSESILFYQGLA